ncbi:MAG: PD-(D/E)XK nuclease family protein, partial [Armatimonadetes bacterium]|nr:PD-(D/E)XK nuclease family protein [Armatimonadota bacterium]
FYRSWPDGLQGRGISTEEVPAAQEMMSEIVDQVFDDVINQQKVGDVEIFETKRDDIRRDMFLWVLFEAQRKEPGECDARHLEASFGYGRVPPLVISDGGVEVRLCGRIDRMDRFATEEGTGFAVYDYKSSRGPSAISIKRGLDFQLPVYALAAREVILDDPQARCLHWGYYKVRRDIYLPKGPKPEEIEDYIADAKRHATRHAEGIRAGRFAPVRDSGDPPICTWCRFKSLCRWEPWRFERKQQSGGDADEQ